MSRLIIRDAIFSSNKKVINCVSRATLWQKNSFAVEVTFNEEIEDLQDIFKID